MVKIDEISSPGSLASAGSASSGGSSSSRGKKKRGSAGGGNVSSSASVSSITTTTSAASTGISEELMKVAIAGWEKSEQGPVTEGMDPEAGKMASSPGGDSILANALDPQACKPLLSSRVNQAVAILNLLFGILYLNWRLYRSMNPVDNWRVWSLVGENFVDPDDPEKAWSVKEELRLNWFGWILFIAEILFMMYVWLGHVSRCFPSKRTKCTMDELVAVDFELSKATKVCIIIPSRGEPLGVLREVILHAMSLHLWPGKLDVRKNARLVVIDDRRRAEVLLLIALCYRFANLFCNNRKVRTQLKLEGRSELSLAAFYEHYLQCTAGFGKTYSDNFIEIFEVADMISKLCKDDCIPQEWDGEELPSGSRIEPQSVQTDLAKVPRLREDFDDIRSIISLVYFSKPASEFSSSSPVASMLNGLLFPEDPADTEILGGARFLVVNDPHHALQPEYLQRTMPYFYKPKLNEQTGAIQYVDCNEVAFVQVPLRYKDRKDKDPLSNRELVLNDIVSVGRDGVGGAMARRHACIYRVDVLKQGKNVKGQPVIAEEEIKDHIGNGIGFSCKTRCEWIPTSLDVFQRCYKSVYVNERGETLSVCVDEPLRLNARIQETFDYYISALEVGINDPLGLIKSPYTTIWHRLFIIEDLYQGFFLGLSIELLILCAALYCYLWRRPFFTHGVEILFFFVPYYFTAALPTALGLNWKRTPSDPAFRSAQFAFTTAFVPLVAYLGGGLSEFSRVICSRTGHKQFSVEGCPSWPLYATFMLMVASLIVTFIHWAQTKFHHAGLWLTSCVIVGCVLGLMTPAAMRGVKFEGLSSFYFRYLSLAAVLVTVACWQQAAPQALPHK